MRQIDSIVSELPIMNHAQTDRPVANDSRTQPAGRKRLRWLAKCLLAAVVMLLAVPSLQAIEIYDYTSPKNDLFVTNGSTPSGISPNLSSSFIGLGLDYSGVIIGANGHGSTRGGVLINSQYFLSSKHRTDETEVVPDPNDSTKTITIPAYSSIRIVDRNNTFRDYPVAGFTTLSYTDPATHVVTTSDLILGKLSSPIADPVAFYPIYSPAENLINRQVQVVGPFALDNTQTISGPNAVGLNNIDAIGSVFDGTNLSQGFEYSYTLGKANEAGLLSGDSGDPSFIRYGNTLALVGIHLGNSGPPGPNSSFTSADTFAPYYISQINAAMSSSGFQVTVVPEPSSGLLLVLGVIGGGFYLRRRNRHRLAA